MAANALTITKTYRDGTTLTEAQLDNIKNNTEAWAQDVVDNLNQIRLDIFGSSYSYDNDGAVNNANTMNVQQTITPTATITGLTIASASLTTGTGIAVSNLDALTTGSGITVTSNSADTGTRNIVSIVNDNTAATGATCLNVQQDAAIRAVFVDQNANALALYIDPENTSANIIQVDTNTLTTGNMFISSNADLLTTGGFFALTSNSADTGTRSLVSITNDNTAATGASCINLVQDSNQRALFIDYNGTGGSTSSAPIYIDSEGTSGMYITVNGNGDGFRIDMENGAFNNSALEIQCTRAANSAYDILTGYSSGDADVEVRLRGNGDIEGDGAAYVTPAADYAEMFEADNVDGIGPGFFVTYSGELSNKIRKATSADKDILGVVSGHPACLADAAWGRWGKKYLYDEFCRYVLDYNGDRVLNPNFNPDKEYIPRAERKEWSPVGMLGKLNVRTSEDITSTYVDVDDSGMAKNGKRFRVIEIIRQKVYDPEKTGYGVVRIVFN